MNQKFSDLWSREGRNALRQFFSDRVNFRDSEADRRERPRSFFSEITSSDDTASSTKTFGKVFSFFKNVTWAVLLNHASLALLSKFLWYSASNYIVFYRKKNDKKLSPFYEMQLRVKVGLQSVHRLIRRQWKPCREHQRDSAAGSVDRLMLIALDMHRSQSRAL